MLQKSNYNIVAVDLHVPHGISFSNKSIGI
jgi:hypothetical protein